MPAQVTNHKCPACTGPLHFSSNSGGLECDFCGSKYTVEEIEALYAQEEQQAASAFAKEEEKRQETRNTVEDSEESWDTSGMTNDWGSEGASMRAYNCPSCGAELICDETTAATSCPYCGNPTVVPGQFGGVLKPDQIIPFKLDKQAAIAALKKHYKNKVLLPKAFKDENHIKELKGVYAPFWLYDAQTSANCLFHATRTHIHMEGDWEVTVTDHYQIHRAGDLSFEGVPADGSKKMPDDYMDSIEPYDYREFKPFSTAYLPGYMADRYDVSAEDNAERADERCRNSTISFLRSDVIGYESVILENNDFNIKRGRVRYALMPVWMLFTKWGGKDYLFMMNGQTGKLVGDLPISKGKLFAIFAAITAAISGLCIFAGIGQWIASMFLG